jgi:hypothetical protein
MSANDQKPKRAGSRWCIRHSPQAHWSIVGLVHQKDHHAARLTVLRLAGTRMLGLLQRKREERRLAEMRASKSALLALAMLTATPATADNVHFDVDWFRGNCDPPSSPSASAECSTAVLSSVETLTAIGIICSKETKSAEDWVSSLANYIRRYAKDLGHASVGATIAVMVRGAGQLCPGAETFVRKRYGLE